MDPPEEGRRRRCQACHKLPAEHHCQACRRFICDTCLAPRREVVPRGGVQDEDFLEDFLQAALVRCRACEEDPVRLPPHDVHLDRS